jgi:catechol 2,3-dioxygenase-like lactoylglutathione lyase family enzyme
MAIPAVISLVTLGVRDVGRSTAFYEAIGFELSSASVPGEVSFFRTAGGLLGLYGAEKLRLDARDRDLAGPDADDPGGDGGRGAGSVAAGAFRGVTLAVNVESPAAVDLALADAAGAGAVIRKAPQVTEWGGYHGYFADPDGHAWEVAHNPYWPLGPNGLPQLP